MARQAVRDKKKQKTVIVGDKKHNPNTLVIEDDPEIDFSEPVESVKADKQEEQLIGLPEKHEAIEVNKAERPVSAVLNKT